MKVAKMVMVLIWMLGLIACGTAKDDTAIFPQYHNARMVYFSRHLAEADTPMMIGDSITESWGNFPSWPSGLTNRGIASDTTSGVVERINAHIAEKPSQIILLIGSNNFFLAAGRFQKDIDTIIAKTQAANVPLMILSILPTLDPAHDSKIQFFNDVLMAECERYNVRFINIYDDFKTNGYFNASLFVTDGIHPNAAGYDLMAKLFVDKHVVE